MDSTSLLLSPDRESTLYLESASTSLHSGTNKAYTRPKLQILLLCYACFMEPLAFYSIFPYIAQMTQRNGNLTEFDIGFYSGLFESLFSAVQAVYLIFWSSMADRYGGKTILIFNLLETSAGTLLFGFATSLWQMAPFRSLSGAVAGATVIVRTMIGERCTSETRT
ncbi:uncharacterized protein FTOL_03102 [Fusarium torulosum]|uniref:Major facilitator superfamily (MFS) profile domain-containing protein n=1 Tax=Fusarium torulosum TaxID=33205 RepID=A0AAE8M3A3_9HYPO|nr:uncharacterized protein FTOL_03102 [Fusarium torulosum]